MSQENSRPIAGIPSHVADDDEAESGFVLLLRPLLEHAAAKVLTLARSEDSGQLVPIPSDRDLTALEARFSGATSSAIHALEVAGLVAKAKGGPWRWRASAAGKELLEKVEGVIGVAHLRSIASYSDYWRGIEEEQRRRKLLSRRLEHYAAGRLLVSRRLYKAAAVELAYAIEFHLKAALGEVHLSESERQLLEKSHDLPRLFALCKKKSLLGSARISVEFLCLARDHFDRRYPSGERALMERERYMRDGADSLHVYDDCIVQLDLALAADYGSTDYLLGKGAIYDSPSNSAYADAMFASNVFAFEHLGAYEEVPGWGRYSISRDRIVRDSKKYFCEGSTDEWRGRVGASELIQARLAELYRYPRQGEPDPNPTRLIPRFQRRLPVFTPEWVVKCAVARFGSFNVDVVEHGRLHGREIELLVFDRGAKQWWCRFPLRIGHRDLWRDTPAAREMLDLLFQRIDEVFLPRWTGKLPNNRSSTRASREGPLEWARRYRRS